MKSMDIQDLNGPFRATKLWNEAIQLFCSGMPVRRHRWHMRCYNKSFSGTEAVAWFHKALVRSPYFGADVTYQQTQQLLGKFMKADVFHSIKGSLSFKETDIYMFGNAAVNELTHSMRMPLATKVVNNAHVVTSSQRQSCGSTECTKRTSVHKQDEQKHIKHNYTTKINQENVGLQSTEQGKCADIEYDCRYRDVKYKRKKQPTEVSGMQTVCADSHPSQGAALKQFVMLKLEELLPELNFKLWIPFELIDPKWVIINSDSQYIHFKNQSELPVWVLGAIQNLLNPEERETVYSYDGFEKDVFNAVRDYFGQLAAPLINYQMYDLMIQTHLHLIQMDIKLKTEEYQSKILASESVENLVLNMSSPCKQRAYSINLVNTSKITSTVLPPNTCFETAFTSDTPVTRIVPQSSVDTVQLGFQHLYRCSPNQGAHNEVYLEQKQLKKPKGDNKFSTKANQTDHNISTKLRKSVGDNQNNTLTYSSVPDPVVKIHKSCDQQTVRRSQSIAQSMNSLHRKNSFLKRTKSSIDRCIVSAMTKDCNKNLYSSSNTKCQNTVLSNSKDSFMTNDVNSRSTQNLLGPRGYINFGMSQSLDDLAAADSILELDYTKAIQSLQKLVHYSKKPYSSSHEYQSSEDEALSHHTESTYSSSDESCKQCVSNDELSPYHGFTDVAPRNGTVQWSLLLDASGQLDPVWYHDMCFHGDMVLGVLGGQSSSTMEIHLLCHRIKGEAWMRKTEELAESVYQLLLLFLPPEKHASLSLLLRFISYLPYHKLCDLTEIEVMHEFSGNILNPPKETKDKYDDYMLRYGLVHFLVRHHEIIMSDLTPDLVQQVRCMMKSTSHKQLDIAYCERLTQQQFEAQKESGSREAISELLKQIIDDKKMKPKKKKKQLKMFQAAYPHIYKQNCPDNDVKQNQTATGLQYITCKIKNLRN